MKTNTAKELIKELPLSLNDVARVVLEITERLGEAAEGRTRSEMMGLLRQVGEEGVRAVKAAAQTMSFEEAARASLNARKDRRPTTRRDLRHFIGRMLRVEGVASRPLRAMTSSECRALLEQAFDGSVHSYRKGRAILHSIFAYGYRHEWCDANPVSRIEVPRVEEKEIVPLSAHEIRQLQTTVSEPQFEQLQLPLHLMLYCGIRPAEVERVDPVRDINWAEKTVTIRPSASKTGGGRVIPLRGIKDEGIRKWKEQTSLKHAPKLWRSFRRRAGFKHWVPDVLRHTFATYHAVHFRNLPELQLEMGHRDASLLRTRYVNAAYVSRKEARAFWRV